MVNRRELVVAVVSDASQFSQGFNKANKEVNNFGKQVDRVSKGGVNKLDGRVNAVTASVKGLAVTAAAAFGTQQILGFVNDSVQAFSDLEQSVGAVESVFGDGAEEIFEFTRAAADLVGLSESAANALSARLGAQLLNFGFTADAARESTKRLIEVGADLAATYGGTVQEAVSAVSSLLRGERDPIEKYAVTITAASVAARALELGLADSTSELDAQAKTMATLDLLYEQTTAAQGQFGREADTLAGKQERLNAELENVKAEIGEELAPIMLELLQVGKELLPVFSELVVDLADMAAELAPLIGFGGDFIEVLSAIRERVDPFAFIFDLFGDSAEDATDKAQVGAEGALEAYREFGAGLTEGADNVLRMKAAAEETGGAVSEARQKLIDAANAAKQADFDNESLSELRNRLREAETSARNTRLAILELANPAFAAARAREREASAEEDLAEARKKGNAQEIAQAELDLAQARIESFSALERFDGAGVAGSVKLIADALGVSFDRAQELLATLGILDGTSLDIPIVFNISTIGAPPDLNELALGRQGLLPGQSGSTTNNNITVNNPSPRAAPSDIARELIIQSSGSFAESNIE